MTTQEAILRSLEPLAEAEKQQVLDFVEFIKGAVAKDGRRMRMPLGSAFSLVSAMRGMEDEVPPYTLADVKESFR